MASVSRRRKRVRNSKNSMSWGRFSHFGKQAIEAGNFQEAERLLRIAVEKAESAGASHWRLATSLNNLAEVYRLQGRFDEAEALYRCAIQIDEKLFEANSTERSVPLRESGIKISYGDPASDLASDLNNLALLCDAQGRYSEAISLFRRAIRIAESVLILRNFAETLRHIGQVDEAAEMDSRADMLTSSRY